MGITENLCWCEKKIVDILIYPNEIVVNYLERIC